MLAVYIFASYLLLTAVNVLACLAILEWAMQAHKRQPRNRRQRWGTDLLWTN